MISIDCIIEKSADLMMAEIDNEAVILGLKSGNYIGLNEMGTEIWTRLSQPIRVSALIHTLIEIYEEDENTIKAHVIDFLNSLLEKSLIIIIDETIL